MTYTDLFSPGILQYDRNDFIKGPRIFFNKKGDTLRLTKKEKKYLIDQLDSIKNYSWKEGLFKNSKRIVEVSTVAYLKADKNRTVYQFSKPIFIRDKSICLVNRMRLCCGGINGPTHFGFFKKENNVWKSWITVSSGAF